MLRLVALTLLVALAAGRLAGGRLKNLGAIRVTALPVALASAGFVVAARAAGGGIATALQYAGIASVGVFLAINATRLRGWLRIGLAVLAFGWALNALVITTNGGMPLSLSAYEKSGQEQLPTPGEGGFFAIDVADEHTVLRQLGDVIPVAPLRTVASPGDLIMGLGLIVIIVAGMRTRSATRTATAQTNPQMVGAFAREL